MEGVHKKREKNSIVDLDEDNDDDMPGRRNLTRWNKNEEMLLAETWIEHSQDANIGKDQQDDMTYMERYGNKKFQYVHIWNILKNYPKWNAAEPIDEDNLQELFGRDPRERPAGKQQALEKQKLVDVRKCDATERAYEAKREKELAIMKKELAIMQCKELEFLMLDPSSLPPTKRAIIEKKQAEIMEKYPDA
ncbi:hypothetical protein Tco_0257885 [Tanacetum coccineum]